jgi:predicted heme/steroid binding protein
VGFREAFRMLIGLAIFGSFISPSAYALKTKNRIFTPVELSFYNGANGKPAYVAVDGVVYDVSASNSWRSGIHEGIHQAGKDLTDEMLAAPHGKEVLRNMPSVGILQQDKTWIPHFLITLLSRYPILLRHPHPFFVHFPMAFVFAGAIFIILHLVRPQLAPFEKMTFAMLIMGILFTPPAIISGLWSWWMVYSLHMLPQVFYKIVLSIALLLTEIVCLLLRIGHPFERTARGWVYFALILFLAVDSLAIGFFGGQLTYGF